MLQGIRTIEIQEGKKKSKPEGVRDIEARLVAWDNLYQEERLTKPQLHAVSERIAEIILIWNTTGYSSP